MPVERGVVPSSADPHGVAMREQSFGFCQRFGGIREAQKALIRDGLHADAFHEVCGRETAALVRPAAGREDVIAAGDVIAERLRAPRAEKNCPGGGDFLEKRRGIIRKAEMFRCEAVAKNASGFERRREQDRAGLAHGLVRGIVWRKVRQLRLNLFLDGARQLHRWCYQKASRIRRMFGLGEEIGSDPFWVAFRRENYGFCGASWKINCTIAPNELLSSRDEAIPRAADLFDALNGFCPVSERGDRMGASDAGDFRNAEEVRSGEQRVIGMRANDHDLLNSSGTRGDDGH